MTKPKLTPEEVASLQQSLLVALWPDVSTTAQSNNIDATYKCIRPLSEMTNEQRLYFYIRLTAVAAQIQIFQPREEIKLELQRRDLEKIKEIEKKRKEPKIVKGKVPNWKKIKRTHTDWTKEDCLFFCKIQKNYPTLNEDRIIEMIEAMTK